MSEETNPVSSTEEETDLKQAVEISQKLEDMITMPGWNEVLAPWLRSLQRTYENGILSKREYIDLIAAQQSINTIELIFEYVKNNIEIGKGASLKLDK